MRTPRNILQHELIGLDCEVVDAENKSQVGIKGRVIDETMKTVVLETKSNRKIVPKKNSTLRVKLENATVDISGDALLARPEDRIKKELRRW